MIADRISMLSGTIAVVERRSCAALVAAIVALILLNVVTRAFDVALFWVDELAVYLMIWMALIGGSLLLHEQRHIAVSIVSGAFGQSRGKVIAKTVDVLVLGFAVGLLLMCIAWYDPVGLVRHGFDIEELAANTYNFIYQEPTNTLGIRKFWVWLVVPIVSCSMTLHALDNLLSKIPMKEPG